MMQETRQHILEILKERKEATVDDIVLELRSRRGDITAVTVRHHLTKLQQSELVTAPRFRHKNTPGRPQHVYSITEKALNHFPNNYQKLAESLLEQIQQHVPPQGINVILEGVAETIASDISDLSSLPMEKRLKEAVNLLNNRGYNARWEQCDGGWILHTANCPYHELAQKNEGLCHMDMRLISKLIGIVPRQMTYISKGEPTCSYFIPCQE